MRLTVFAGQSFVKIDHIFFNRLDAKETKVRRLAAQLPVKLDGNRRYHAGGRHRPGPPMSGPAVYAGGKPMRVEQLELNHHRATGPAGKKIKEDNRNMAGFVNVTATPSGKRSEARGLLLAGKWFWQNYPKAVEIKRDSVVADLIPRQRKLFSVPRGMAKQHTFFLAFHDGLTDNREVSDFAYALQRWPMPSAPSEYYQQTGQVWDYFPAYAEQYQRLEAAFREFYPPDREDLTSAALGQRAWGLKHYGDWVTCGWSKDSTTFDPDARDIYYINNEYDTAHVLAMLFLRQPDIIRWWGAEAHALHTMDVDTAHHVPGKETQRNATLMTNCQYRHCYQHIGGIQSLDESYTGAGLSHTFAEGINDYYHLTGDARARRQVLGTARQLAEFTLHPKGYVWGLSRNLGWGMLIMGAAHMIQPDKRVIEAANAMIDKVINVEMDPDGKVYGSPFHPNSWSDRGISLGVRGLIKWHQATGCEKTKKLFLGLMNQFVEMCFGAEGLPAASNWPEGGKPTTATQGFANLEGLAYAFDLTGDRKFLDAGLGALAHAVGWVLDPESDPGMKSGSEFFMRCLRGPFRFLALAHEHGILQRMPEAGRWVP